MQPIVQRVSVAAYTFLSKVHKTETCWLWTASGNNKGYGQVTIARIKRLAHRVSWELHRGFIPDGMCVLHKCDNPPCVNPDHLFLGTKADNTQDMIEKGRLVLPPVCRSGELNQNSRLTPPDVRAIRSRYAVGGISKATLGRLFGVCDRAIHKIVARKTWIGPMYEP